MKNLSILLVTLTSVISYQSAFAAEAIILDDEGVEFYQLDYPDDQPAQFDSSVGLVEANLLLLRAVTGFDEGFLNVVTDGNWVVRNMPVFAETDYPYSHLSTEFDLGVIDGTAIASLDTGVLFSEQVYQTMPSIVASSFPVDNMEVVVGGAENPDSGSSRTGDTPPTMEGVFFGNPGNTTSIFQLDHPNIEAAVNQCAPASVANSLQFLENTTDLEIPHEHVPGLRGDSSLVGQLGLAMNRTATSRLAGNGILVVPEVQGKLKYLAANGLQDRVQTRHWGTYYDETNAISQTVDGKTATSTAMGKNVEFDDLLAAMQGGEDCEANYMWDAEGDDPAGAHAVEIVAAGRTNGQPWIVENSDVNQKSDTNGAGAQGFQFSHLSSPDASGRLTLNGGNKKIYSMICQKYIPPVTTSGTFLPPPGENISVPGVDLDVTGVTDPANHSCCTTPPPASTTLQVNNRDFSFLSAPGPWSAATFTVDDQGSISGQFTTTVAGFSNINNTVSGTMDGDSIIASFTLGANGGLPQQLPITYEIELVPTNGWPWLESVPVAPEVSPAVRVNGFRHNHNVDAGDPISITLDINAGQQNTDSDWWIVATAGALIASFDLATGSWVDGLTPTFQGPLVDVPNSVLFSSTDGLPQGDYSIYFGVDDVGGGIGESLIFDVVNLTVR